MYSYLEIGKRYVLHRGIPLNFQSSLGNGLTPEGKEKDKARQAVFLTPTNLFGNDLRKKSLMMFLSSTDSTLRNSLETRPKCCVLSTIIKNAASRNGILADEVICNHDLQIAMIV